MRLYELISEARRNPGQNIKVVGHEGAIKFLKDHGKDIRDYGISMTAIPKLGINPGSNYNTPVGIYFYPAEFYMKIKGGKFKDKLPFQDHAPYIQIFKMYGNVERIDELNDSQFNSYTAKLFRNISKVAQLIGDSEINTEKKMSYAVMKSGTEAIDSSYGGRLWYVLFSLSRNEGAQKRDSAAPRSSVIWNSLLRLLGMDGVIDGGAGIIHKNEPYQGVMLNPRSIELVTTVDNPQTNKIDTMNNQFINLANMKVDDFYIKNIVQYVRELELKYSPKNRKYTEKIVNNVLEELRKWPVMYTRLDISDINFILQLNKRPEVVKELTVGLYAAKFPRIKKELDEMIEDWNITRSELKADAPEARKQRAHAMAVPQYKVDQATKVIRDLKPFKSDPEAAQIIEYLQNAINALKYN